MNKMKIGIMGGTFDPIHNGHLTLAEYSRVNFGLDKILFIPTGKPPHKNNKEISSNWHRYNMTLLATSSNPYYDLSSIELEREGITYTIDTIRYLKSESENREIYFILGSDSLFGIDKWKDYKELLGECNFIVTRRPDLTDEKLEEKIKELSQISKNSILTLDSPLIDISSTQIRDRVRKGLSIRYLIPEGVRLYIEKNKLYR